MTYVVEGEKITYTIKLQNNGGLAQDVIVKDTIPTGTTFVAGSIKVDGKSKYNVDGGEVDLTSKTASDLAKGIKVNVPAKEDNIVGETTISFEVTVNDLQENTFTKQIVNIATVNKNPDKAGSTDEPTNEVTTTVNKPNLKYSKLSNPTTGSTVKEGDEITYTIHLDNSTGKAPITAIVKDTIPTGTTFVVGSIKVGGQAQNSMTSENLKNGISVDLSAGQSKDVEFKVKVNDLNNGTSIKNVATVNDNSTNETVHKYVEAIITANKEVKTENNVGYVIEGEKITYTIKVQNSGGLSQNVLIKDNIPQGTTFVAGSIKVNGKSKYNVDSDEVDLTSKTASDLAKGIKVNVPAKEAQTIGETTVSFEVTVDVLEGDTLTKSIVNTATVNKDPEDPDSPDEPTNEVITTVNKADLKYSKSSNPATGSIVKEGDEITYTIHIDNSTGKAPTIVVVKDTIPAGTTFVVGSIKVGGQAQNSMTSENLKDGISVDLSAGQSKDVEFKVKVNDLNNGTLIKNVAKVNDNSTNEIVHKYVEAIITANKEVKTANNLSYAVEGEKITYTIKLQNSGEMAQDVIVKDNIPEGTTFVEGSIKVNGESKYNVDSESIDLTTKTADDLAKGIKVNVPAKEAETIGETTVSFEVTVNTLDGSTLTREIVNTATVNKKPENPDNPDEPTNEVITTVNKPNLKYSKSSTPVTGSTVKEGDEITYTIHLDNTTGKASINAVVKDNIPPGTAFVAGSIKIGGKTQSNMTGVNLKNGISVNVEAGESKDVEFKVRVQDLENGTTIKNVATVNDNSTNETVHKYVKAIITANKEVKTENSLAYVVEGEKITYTIKVQNSGELSQDVVVKDNIPEGTTFVDGSIKINGAVDENKTE